MTIYKTRVEDLSDITAQCVATRFVLIMFCAMDQVVTVLIDKANEEYISFVFGNLVKRSSVLKADLERMLATILPMSSEFEHIMASILCSNHDLCGMIHAIVSLTTILDYMVRYPRLPQVIIYPARLIRQMVFYLTLSRICANNEARVDLSESSDTPPRSRE